jgi:hypothetical protein
MNAQQIVQLASFKAKGGTGMVALVGQCLNVVLEELKLNKDLKVNRVTQMVTIPPASYGPFLLEGDYLRTYDMFYPLPTSGGGTSSSITQFLTPVTMEQFDAEFKSPSISNYPYERATDLSSQAQAAATAAATALAGTPTTSAGYFYVYPQSSGTIVVTHRYMVNQPDIAAPETSKVVPWFPYTQYLITATAAEMMGVTGDNREKEYRELAMTMLRPHLIMEGDEQETVRAIRLDPRKFHFARGLKPTKAAPY